MAHNRTSEALDRALKDLRSNQNLFEGAMILLAGDLRQTLPVIPGSTVADQLSTCLKAPNFIQRIHGESSTGLISFPANVCQCQRNVFPKIFVNYENHA